MGDPSPASRGCRAVENFLAMIDAQPAKLPPASRARELAILVVPNVSLSRELMIFFGLINQLVDPMCRLKVLP